MWIGIVVAVVVSLAAAVMKRRISGGRRSNDVDVGSVSEGWLSEQRGRKDS